MELYFAVDIKDGKVVWGCGGEREKYEEISKHSFVKSSIPLEVLKEIKPKRVYIADLNAIEGKGKNDLSFLNEKYIKIAAVDRGYKNKRDIKKDGKIIPVLGSETYDLREVVDDVFVSLDFKNGFLSDINLATAIEILNSYNLRGVIVLDIKRVGKLSLNYSLIKEILDVSTNPVYAAGGIKCVEDLEKLNEMGVKGAILATAIHKRRIPLHLIR